MIVIAGTVSFDPAKSDEAFEAARWMMEETQKEEGNIAYIFSSDLREDGVINIFEHWTDQAALDFHFTSPHMAEFQKKMGAFGIRGMEVKKYEVSSVGPLG